MFHPEIPCQSCPEALLVLLRQQGHQRLAASCHTVTAAKTEVVRVANGKYNPRKPDVKLRTGARARTEPKCALQHTNVSTMHCEAEKRCRQTFKVCSAVTR